MNWCLQSVCCIRSEKMKEEEEEDVVKLEKVTELGWDSTGMKKVMVTSVLLVSVHHRPCAPPGS